MNCKSLRSIRNCLRSLHECTQQSLQAYRTGCRMSVTSLIVPQKQAGGGQPSSHQSMNTVSNISASVLSYLKAIADGRRPLDADQLSEFNIFHSAQTPESTKDYCKLDLRKLLQYMTSSESNAMRPHEENDLSHPISSYFISSSHNTYLSGNQLYGDASTEAYRNVCKQRKSRDTK